MNFVDSLEGEIATFTLEKLRRPDGAGEHHSYRESYSDDET
jgi:hypothetical protein